MKQPPLNAGYSGTPLVKKLGIEPGRRLAIVNPPAGYVDALVGGEPCALEIAGEPESFDLIQFFALSPNELEDAFPRLKRALAKTGALWVSWPKKAAGVPTDLTENTVRDLALGFGLVDIKVCAVDSTWSGLKLVYRKADR